MSARARRTAQVHAAGVRRWIGKNGEVMIPNALLRVVGLRPGDEVRLSVADGAIRVESALAADALMGRLGGHRLVDSLEADRHAERIALVSRRARDASKRRA